MRYSPNGLVFNNVEALRGEDPESTVPCLLLNFSIDIYGHGRNTQKSMAYAPLPQSTLNIHNCVDTKTHGRKRRIISQSFAAVAVSSYEPTMVGHVRNLCKTLLATAEVGWPLINKDGWSPPQDIFSWCAYTRFRFCPHSDWCWQRIICPWTSFPILHIVNPSTS